MRSFRILVLVLACGGLSACELIADFDRGKLDAGRPPDAGQLLPPAPDAGSSEDAGPEQP